MAEANNLSGMQGIARAVNKQGVSESDRRLLAGRDTRTDRIENREAARLSSIRALESLDTGDPRGLEMLDFGSVRGRPAVAFKAQDGSMRVMQIPMPNYLAGLKARTSIRSAMREKIEADLKRDEAKQRLRPQFTRSLAELPPLMQAVMTNRFENDPEAASVRVAEFNQLRRRDEQAAVEAQQAEFGQFRFDLSQERRRRTQLIMDQRVKDQARSDPSKARRTNVFAGTLNDGAFLFSTRSPDMAELTVRDLYMRAPDQAKAVFLDVYNAMVQGTFIPGMGEVKVEPLNPKSTEGQVRSLVEAFTQALGAMGYSPTTPEAAMQDQLFIARTLSELSPLLAAENGDIIASIDSLTNSLMGGGGSDEIRKAEAAMREEGRESEKAQLKALRERKQKMIRSVYESIAAEIDGAEVNTMMNLRDRNRLKEYLLNKSGQDEEAVDFALSLIPQ